MGGRRQGEKQINDTSVMKVKLGKLATEKEGKAN